MKQVTYEIKGIVLASMIPSITASCESLTCVKNVRIISKDDAPTQLILVVKADTHMDVLEDDLRLIMNNKGLSLTTPPLSETAHLQDAPQGQDTPQIPNESIPTEPTDPPKITLPKKKERKVGLTAAISAVIIAIVLSVLTTTAVTTLLSDRDNGVVDTESEGTFEQLDVIDRLFRSATVLEAPDDKALVTAILKAYVAATGDKYAEYFTAEEYADQNAANNGELCGIGVSVINGLATVGGVEYQVITVANVYPDSPAMEAGVMPGDHIMYVVDGETRTSVNEIGYTEALNRMRGEEGTTLSFIVLRTNAEGQYEEVEITATRRKLTTLSVFARVYTEDPTVGIIKLTGFDNTTRDQFEEAVKSLQEQGCTGFVLDLRNNPGGLLSAVEDVLVFFLQEGDTIITTENSAGQKTVDKVGVNSQGKVTCGSGKLTAEDVGKYRDLKFSVLVNGQSASAAELFTSNIRDYELGRIIGTNTYGKGCGQTTMPLSKYGYDGALKLTTFYYYAPGGECYHGVGIKPHVEVELSDEAKTYNINLLPDELDNQLAAAVAELKK